MLSFIRSSWYDNIENFPYSFKWYPLSPDVTLYSSFIII